VRGVPLVAGAAVGEAAVVVFGDVAGVTAGGAAVAVGDASSEQPVTAFPMSVASTELNWTKHALHGNPLSSKAGHEQEGALVGHDTTAV
jgi:hypothetical protein